jgi:hypothetical protein
MQRITTDCYHHRRSFCRYYHWVADQEAADLVVAIDHCQVATHFRVAVVATVAKLIEQ